MEEYTYDLEESVESRIAVNFVITTEYSKIYEVLTCTGPKCNSCYQCSYKMINLKSKDSTKPSFLFCAKCYDVWKERQPLLGSLLY